jgi:hypothetical protein
MFYGHFCAHGRLNGPSNFPKVTKHQVAGRAVAAKKDDGLRNYLLVDRMLFDIFIPLGWFVTPADTSMGIS